MGSTLLISVDVINIIPLLIVYFADNLKISHHKTHINSKFKAKSGHYLATQHTAGNFV